jgi:tyrosine-protein phosphatase non-receptor type 9
MVNKCRAGRRAGPVSWSTAVKFLSARKFEVSRALALYEQHEATRRREGLALMTPTREPLLSELRTGKFTVLVGYFASAQQPFLHRAQSS